MPTVTGLVLTFNGERLLDRCLESLDFCDEILVVDSQSTDRTREIAEARGARVIVNPWPGPAGQFAFALEKISSDWIVSLDQDEYLTDELKANVREALARDEDLPGYLVSRCSFYLDRFIRHSGWYPDLLLRVFRRGRMEVRVSPPHYSFHALGGTPGRLRGDIVHYPFEDLRQHLSKINSYTQEAADALRAKGRGGGVLAGLLHGLSRFVKIYVLKLGVLDGRAGFVIAVHGFFYAFHKYLRVEERRPWGQEALGKTAQRQENA